jgi:DNA-binding CsgD family transcriptional regulator
MFDVFGQIGYSDGMKLPFIGRNDELTKCTGLLQKNNICRLITIEGVPGIGKTAFLHKIQEIAEQENYELHPGVINEGQETLSLQVWMQILEKCRLNSIQQENNIPAGDLEKNIFSALYGSWDNIASFKEIGIENKKHLLFSWIGSYLARYLENRRACISIDNAHLCSKSSIDLLSYLLSVLDAYHVVFVITFRPEETNNNKALQILKDEFQFHPHWEGIYLKNLNEKTMGTVYNQLKSIQADLPDEASLFDITKGNPLRLSAFMQINQGTNIDQKPLSILWRQYKNRMSPGTLKFTEYISLLGNYFTEAEAGSLCTLLGEPDYYKILTECFSLSIVIKQGDGFSFFHDDFRKIIEQQIPEEEKQFRLLQLINLLENKDSSEKDKSILRIAGLYKIIEKGVTTEKRMSCFLLAADIMERWNAWDDAAVYLEEVQAISIEAGDIDLQDEVECRLAKCYVENLDMNKCHMLILPLGERLLERNQTDKLFQIMQLNPFIWNFIIELLTRITNRLLKVVPVNDARRNILLIAQSGLQLGNVENLTKIGLNLINMENSILSANDENNKYLFFFTMGMYCMTTRNFSSAIDYLLQAELLPVSNFRFLHLFPQIKIALFTGYKNNKTQVLENTQNILKVTQTQIIKLTYEGMMQRRYLYDGDWSNVLKFGDEDPFKQMDYFSLPKFITYLWTGEVEIIHKSVEYIISITRQAQIEHGSKGPFQGLVWPLSIYSMLYNDNSNLEIIRSGVENLLSEKYTPSGFRQHALVSAARVSRWIYSAEDCMDFYNELVSYDPYFLDEEIHSIEIAKALLSERLENPKAQEAHYLSALEWCKEVDEWPWRCWIYAQLSIFYSKTDLTLSKQNRNQAVEIARRLNINHILSILGEKTSLSTDNTKETQKENSKLSPRETEVLKLLSKGYTDKEIGKYLFISEHTVANHLRKIYRKIDASNRVEASRIAMLEGIIDETNP